MKQRKNCPGLVGLVILATSMLSTSSQADDHGAETTWDGLVEIDTNEVYRAFADPDAEFGGFTSVAILEPYVAFRSNWKRDQNRSRSRNVRASDVERIKQDVAYLFVDVFTEQLDAAGYNVVNYGGEEVLVLRPAILDLDITAPDVNRAGRNRTYAASTGAATLALDLFDSLTGDLLGRAIDRRTARRAGGFAMRSNRVTNRADARREFRVWADQLIAFLDMHYVKADSQDSNRDVTGD